MSELWYVAAFVVGWLLVPKRLKCRLFGHQWRVAQPIPFVPFDQGGVRCDRCSEFHWVGSPEAVKIAEEHGL